MRPARAAILDFNGTVAEDEALLIGIYEDLLREQGVAFEAAHYWRYAGLPDQAMFEHLFAAHGRRLEPTTVDLLLRERVERYLAAVSDEHPVADHTIAFIHALAAHVPVGVASGAFREEIEHVLEAAGLSRLVSVIVAIDEVEAGKPIPRASRPRWRTSTGGGRRRLSPRTRSCSRTQPTAPAPPAPQACVVWRCAARPTTRTAARPSWWWTG
jgi:beta-phosphoglucomutase-like phosphatase (HAD superfamily)